MKYAFKEMFDIPKLTELCEAFTRINGTVTALLDLEGNVHIKTGWQHICTDFHRRNTKSAARCLESDTIIASKLAQGETYNVYQCKNGLVDIAVPIFVDGEHVANFFTGQFLFQQPDKAYFKKQAKELNIELIPYMDALRQVPVFSEPEIRKIITFLVALARTFGELGKSRLDILRLRDKEHEQNEALKKTTIELSRAKMELEKLALEDVLTGLYNRRFFDEALRKEYERACRYKHDLVLCLLDVDKFKDINDTFGHFIGDEVLQRIARVICKNLRKSDVVARIGGDEFAIIFPEANAAEIETHLAQVCHEIKSIPLAVEGEQIYSSCSFGLASLHQSDTSEKILKIRADKALYRSKENGRCQVIRADN